DRPPGCPRRRGLWSVWGGAVRLARYCRCQAEAADRHRLSLAILDRQRCRSRIRDRACGRSAALHLLYRVGLVHRELLCPNADREPGHDRVLPVEASRSYPSWLPVIRAERYLGSYLTRLVGAESKSRRSSQCSLAPLEISLAGSLLRLR